MRILALTTMILILIPAYCFAAENDSAETRYESIKEQTKNTGSVGFNKRHKAYKDYVMESRKNDMPGNVSDIAPAAGDEPKDAGRAPAGKQPQ